MKKWIVTICLLCLCGVAWGNDSNDVVLVADANSMGLTVHVSSELTLGKTNAKLWLGGQKGNSEVGMNFGLMDELSPEDNSYSVGVYGLYHFPDVRTMLENTFWPVEWLPEELEAKPAVGASIEYYDEGVVTFNPLVSMKVMDFLEVMIIYNPVETELPNQNRVTVGLGKIWKF